MDGLQGHVNLFAQHVNALAAKHRAHHEGIAALQKQVDVLNSGRRVRQVSWKTAIPTAMEGQFESKKFNIGAYEVWLEAKEEKAGFLAVFVKVSGATMLFPVNIGGSTISLGGKLCAFPEASIVPQSGMGLGPDRFMTIGAALAAALFGKVTVSASIVFNEPAVLEL